MWKEIDRIKPPRFIIRKDMGDIDALAESIKQHGLIHPIMIDTDYEIIHGHRRWLAAKKAGMAEISCEFITSKTSDQRRFELALAENSQRKTMTNEELVEASKMYLTNEGWGGQTRLAKVLGVDKSYITQLLSSSTIKEQIPEAKDLSTATAYEISKIPEPEKRAEVTKTITEEKIPQLKARAIIKKVREGKPVKTAVKETREQGSKETPEPAPAKTEAEVKGPSQPLPIPPIDLIMPTGSINVKPARQPLAKPLDRLMEQIEIGIRGGDFTWKDMLAKMDVEMTRNLAASFRSQLSEKSKCPVCGHRLSGVDRDKILDAVSRLENCDIEGAE